MVAILSMSIIVHIAERGHLEESFALYDDLTAQTTNICKKQQI